MSKTLFYISDDFNCNIEIGEQRYFVPCLVKDMEDNIQCEGQYISVESIRADKMFILANAEWGNYNEIIEIIYKDNEKKMQIMSKFYDWYGNDEQQNRIQFNVLGHMDNNIRFYGGIYSSKYNVDHDKQIVAVRLPQNSNIHIYAITFAMI